tara:strand:+ start:268 stop:519 length:252 start_codon:yes stop_codon:yes gene_type:complete
VNKNKKKKIVDQIVANFNDHQVHDSYWFEHSKTQIEWSSHQEAYLILYTNNKWDSCEPRHLYTYVEDLKEQDLEEYSKDNLEY